MKIRVFVGCAAKQFEVAKTVHESLKDVFVARLWNVDDGKLSGNAVNSLLNELGQHDFAIFIIESHQVLKKDKKGQVKIKVDDSVFYEIGLFMGNLGKERTFIILPEKAEGVFESLPFDILGNNFIKYDDDDPEALATICSNVQETILKLGARSRLETVLTQKDAFTYVLNCLNPCDDLRLTEAFFTRFNKTDLKAIREVIPPLEELIQYYVKEFVLPEMRVYFAYKVVPKDGKVDKESVYRLGISYAADETKWNEFYPLSDNSNVHVVYETVDRSPLPDIEQDTIDGTKKNQKVENERSVSAFPVFFDISGKSHSIGVIAVSSAKKLEATKDEFTRLAEEISVLYSALFYSYGVSLQEENTEAAVERIRSEISNHFEPKVKFKNQNVPE